MKKLQAFTATLLVLITLIATQSNPALADDKTDSEVVPDAATNLKLKEDFVGQTKEEYLKFNEKLIEAYKNGEIKSPLSSGVPGLCDSGTGGNSVDFSGKSSSGDILLMGNTTPGAWGRWCHAGMWDGRNSNQRGIWESNPSSGVRFNTYNNQNGFKRANRAVILRVNASYSTRSSAAQWVAGKSYKPYNYNFFDRDTRSKFYCSQLVWAAYKDGAGIDQDSNGAPAVSPDDVYFSNYNYIVQ